MLRVLVEVIQRYLPSSCSLSVDVGGGYSFPVHIIPTDLRPDVVWWDDQGRRLVLVELTIPFETSFEAAVQRKRVNYSDLISAAREKGYDASLVTIEVGGFQSCSGSCLFPPRNAPTYC